MKPLPGDRTGKWRRGVCLQQVGPRSYLVDVDGKFFRRNQVDLRPAERVGLRQHPERDSKGQSCTTSLTADRDRDGEDVASDTGGRELGPARQTALPQSLNGSPSTSHYRPSSSRLVKAPDRLD